MILEILTVIALGAPLPAAVADTGTAPACTSAAHRAFDFWIGEWDVRGAQGSIIAQSKISRIADGCALLEEYENVNGYRGKSINAYDATRSVWIQTWSDNGGLVLTIEGNAPSSGVMRMEGRRRDAQGEVMGRITWTRLPDGAVRQLWEQSRDGGATWTNAFDGRYERRPTP